MRSQLVSTQQQQFGNHPQINMPYGSSRIQVGSYKSLEESEIKDGHFEKSGPCPGGSLVDLGPSYRCGNSPITLCTQLQHFLARSTTCQVSRDVSYLLIPQVMVLLNLILVVDPEVIHDLAPPLLTTGQYYPDTKAKQEHYRKRKLHATVSDEYRCRNSQQSISKTNSTAHYKDHTYL